MLSFDCVNQFAALLTCVVARCAQGMLSVTDFIDILMHSYRSVLVCCSGLPSLLPSFVVWLVLIASWLNWMLTALAMERRPTA